MSALPAVDVYSWCGFLSHIALVTVFWWKVKIRLCNWSLQHDSERSCMMSRWTFLRSEPRQPRDVAFVVQLSLPAARSELHDWWYSICSSLVVSGITWETVYGHHNQMRMTFLVQAANWKPVKWPHSTSSKWWVNHIKIQFPSNNPLPSDSVLYLHYCISSSNCHFPFMLSWICKPVFIHVFNQILSEVQHINYALNFIYFISYCHP